jgi:hypothetical protein
MAAIDICSVALRFDPEEWWDVTGSYIEAEEIFSRC